MLKNVDNIGAYLSAYLGDMELGETLTANSTSGKGFKMVESNDKDGKRQTKAIVKGARLRFYPKGFRLFRKSRGVVPPTNTDCTNAEAMRKIGNAALTYEKTIKIVDDGGKTCNVINYRYQNASPYRILRPSLQAVFLWSRPIGPSGSCRKSTAQFSLPPAQ